MSDEEPRNERTRRLWLAFSAGVILLVLFFAVVVIKPAMPGRVVLLTGPESGAYHEYGLRLASDLDARGIQAEVAITEGSLDNLKRLREGGDVVALAPSIVDWKKDFGDRSGLVAIGSVGLEPFWLFYRSELKLDRVNDLEGRTLATEGKSTTSYQVASQLIDEVGLAGKLEIVPLANHTAEQAIQGFASGELDALFVSGQVSSRGVQSLLHSDHVSLLSFHRGKAIAKRVSGATVVVAPEGVFDLAGNFPPEDTQLLAATTCLVADEDIAPALVPMLLSSVENTSRRSSSFISAGEFPSRDHVTLPLAPSAQRYFRQGEVGLSKHLPYGVVRFLNHLGFFVLPLLTVVIILLKAVPTGLRIIGGMRIKRGFKQLALIEKASAAGDDSATLLAELDRIDQRTATMFVPRSIVHDYVDFRQFLHDMRERVETRDQTPLPAEQATEPSP